MFSNLWIPRRRRPRFLVFFVTSRCNCRCRFCFYRERVENPRPEEELALEEIEKFSRLYGPLTDLSISGGEPFLREDLEEILKSFARNNRPKLIEVPTNGSLPEKTARIIGALCRDFPRLRVALQLSVDGPPDLHEEMREYPGLFEKARETSRALEKMAAVHPNLKVQVITVFSSRNRDRMEEFFRDWLGEFFFHRLILTPCVDASYHARLDDRAREHLRFLEATVAKINRAGGGDRFSRLSSVFHRVKGYMIEHWEERRNLGRYCGAGRRIIVLREQGDVLPCEPAQQILGNIRDHNYDIRALLAGRAAREYFSGYRELRSGCHCSWSCAQTAAALHLPGGLISLAGGLLRKADRPRSF